MKSLLQKLVRASMVAGLGLVATLNANAQDQSPGIVRISKPSTAAMERQQIVPASFGHHGVYAAGSYSDCQNGYGQGAAGCPNGCNRGCYRHPNA